MDYSALPLLLYPECTTGTLEMNSKEAEDKKQAVLWPNPSGDHQNILEQENLVKGISKSNERFQWITEGMLMIMFIVLCFGRWCPLAMIFAPSAFYFIYVQFVFTLCTIYCDAVSQIELWNGIQGVVYIHSVSAAVSLGHDRWCWCNN